MMIDGACTLDLLAGAEEPKKMMVCFFFVCLS